MLMVESTDSKVKGKTLERKGLALCWAYFRDLGSITSRRCQERISKWRWCLLLRGGKTEDKFCCHYYTNLFSIEPDPFCLWPLWKKLKRHSGWGTPEMHSIPTLFACLHSWARALTHARHKITGFSRIAEAEVWRWQTERGTPLFNPCGSRWPWLHGPTI